jgi:PAS domain-containing protein
LVEQCFSPEHMHFMQALPNLLRAATCRLEVESQPREHITALHAAQAAAHESREQLLALAENLPAGMIYQIIVRRDGDDRSFTYVSRSCVRLNGMTAEAVLADPTALYEPILPEHG